MTRPRVIYRDEAARIAIGWDREKDEFVRLRASAIDDDAKGESSYHESARIRYADAVGYAQDLLAGRVKADAAGRERDLATVLAGLEALRAEIAAGKHQEVKPGRAEQ